MTSLDCFGCLHDTWPCLPRLSSAEPVWPCFPLRSLLRSSAWSEVPWPFTLSWTESPTRSAAGDVGRRTSPSALRGIRRITCLMTASVEDKMNQIIPVCVCVCVCVCVFVCLFACLVFLFSLGFHRILKWTFKLTDVHLISD